MRDRGPLLLYRAAEASRALAGQMHAQIGLTARQAGSLTLITGKRALTRASPDRRAFLATATPPGSRQRPPRSGSWTASSSSASCPL
jgi:hypothetical protein